MSCYRQQQVVFLTGWNLCMALLANCAVMGWWENGFEKKIRAAAGGTFRQ